MERKKKKEKKKKLKAKKKTNKKKRKKKKKKRRERQTHSWRGFETHWPQNWRGESFPRAWYYQTRQKRKQTQQESTKQERRFLFLSRVQIYYGKRIQIFLNEIFPLNYFSFEVQKRAKKENRPARFESCKKTKKKFKSYYFVTVR